MSPAVTSLMSIAAYAGPPSLDGISLHSRIVPAAMIQISFFALCGRLSQAAHE